ncbi:MAG: Holliday junction resolvase RuvX [Candidatus Paceibacterota bacterium]
MGVFLGIDYGDTRIGLALSDPEKKLARRFFTLQNENKIKTIKRLKDIIESEGVMKIIIGIPLGFSGKNEQTRKVETFISSLQEEIKIPIETINEVLTSKMAEKNLINSGVRNIKEVLDQEAARIILQDYLDFIKSE